MELNRKEILFGEYVLIGGKRRIWDDALSFIEPYQYTGEKVEALPFPWDMVEKWGFRPLNDDPWMVCNKDNVFIEIETESIGKIATYYHLYKEEQHIIIQYMHEFQRIMNLWGVTLNYEVEREHKDE